MIGRGLDRVQAIELAADALSNVKFVREKKLLAQYFSEISQDTGKYCFGVKDTLMGLDMGAVETLVVWENLNISRYELKNPATGGTTQRSPCPAPPACMHALILLCCLLFSIVG